MQLRGFRHCSNLPIAIGTPVLAGRTLFLSLSHLLPDSSSFSLSLSVLQLSSSTDKISNNIHPLPKFSLSTSHTPTQKGGLCNLPGSSSSSGLELHILLIETSKHNKQKASNGIYRFNMVENRDGDGSKWSLNCSE